MKNGFKLILAVLFFVNIASARTIEFVGEGFNPEPNEEVTLQIQTDTPLFGMGIGIYVVGDANITGAMSEEDCNNYGWDNGYNSDPYIDDANGYVSISGLSWTSDANGVIGYIKFRCNSEQVSVYIDQENSSATGWDSNNVSFSMDTLSFGEFAAYSGGSGEPNSPYRIRTVEDWNDLQNTTADWNKHFILIADVNLQGVTLTPVGNSTTKFTGVFDGNGHIIRNVRINMPTIQYIGLFGYMNSGGQIYDLGVEDVNVIGGNYTGGLVGYNYNGTITGCYVTGVVAVGSSGSYIGGLVGWNYYGTITGCYATVAISTGSYSGGLVGGNSYGTITDCYATGMVTGGNVVGGLVGANSAGIAACYATGSVIGNGHVGGLVGTNFVGGTIATCYATGTVTATYERSEGVGGLVGLSGGAITNCYAAGAVVATGAQSEMVGGLVGDMRYQSGGDIECYTGCYATGSVAGNRYVGGLVGYIQGAGNINACYSTGTVEGNNNVGGLVGYCTGYSIISDCYSTCAVSGSSYIGGLMGYKSYCNMSNCYSTGSVSGSSYVGGLVGYNRKYDNYGDVIKCYSAGLVSGSSYVGGLMGYNYSGTVSASVWDVNTSGQMTSAGGTSKTTVEMKMLTTFTSIGWDFVGETANGTADIWKICDDINYPKLTWQESSACGFYDLAWFVQKWLMTDCGANDNCDGADMNTDGTVNFLDYAIFANNWLEGI